MKKFIRLDLSFVKKFIAGEEIKKILPKISAAHKKLIERALPGGEFLGWVDLPENQLKKIQGIKKLAKEIKNNSDVFIVTGIGGSYLGGRAVIQALKGGTFKGENKPLVLFAGINISGSYLKELLEFIKGKSVYLNVISKSGATLEPALSFRILRDYMEKRYGKSCRKRIIATTDPEKGALNKMAQASGWKMLEIPADVGGRFSVFSPVGLLPIEVAGIDAEKMLSGAVEIKKRLFNKGFNENEALQYAGYRYALYKRGKIIEILANFDPKLSYISEWWKQLFGESEGKNKKGIFPASVNFTTDLHSLGQYIQDGKRNLFETFLWIDKHTSDIRVRKLKDNSDMLNYLAGKNFHYINEKAYRGTRLAHFEGSVPNFSLIMPELSEKFLGQLFYFFEFSVAISGCLLGINAFNQPGVEKYKKNMLSLLKPHKI